MRTTIEVKNIEKIKGFIMLCLYSKPDNKTDVFIDKQGFTFKSNNFKGFTPYESIRSIAILNSNKCHSSKILLFITGDSKWNENMKKKHPIRYKLGLVKLYKDYVQELGIISDTKNIDDIVEVLQLLKYKTDIFHKEK